MAHVVVATFSATNHIVDLFATHVTPEVTFAILHLLIILDHLMTINAEPLLLGTVRDSLSSRNRGIYASHSRDRFITAILRLALFKLVVLPLGDVVYLFLAEDKAVDRTLIVVDIFVI